MAFNFEATGIGSMPFTDPKESCALVLRNFPDAPFWPQLPKRSFLENMYVQYSEGLPGAIVDEDERTIHVDSDKALEEVESVYERYLAADLESFRLSENRASGLYEFLRRPKEFRMAKFVKGQVTGPVSFALSVTDEDKRPIIYNADLFEAATKVLTMKALWQIRRLKDVNPNVIIFIDEPYLVSIGSSYVNVDLAKAAAKLDETAGAVKKAGAVCGIHCCGNTDWSFLLSREIDILNFDAYNFIKQFLLYSGQIKTFLGRGGTIAWGIVPTSDEVEKEDARTLLERFRKAASSAREKGIDVGASSNMVTPSCGAGTLDEKKAARAFALTKEISDILKGGLDG